MRRARARRTANRGERLSPEIAELFGRLVIGDEPLVEWLATLNSAAREMGDLYRALGVAHTIGMVLCVAAALGARRSARG